MSLRNQVSYLTDVNMSLAGLAATGVGPAQEVGVVNRIPLDKPLYGLLLELQFRANVAVITGLCNVDREINLLQRIRVVGQHKRFGERELVNITGREAMILAQKYQAGIGVETNTNLPLAGVVTGVAAYDTRVTVPVFFVPPGLNPAQEALFLVRNDEWTTFDLYLTFGDVTAIAAFAGAQTVTFSDFGGAAGVPRVRVSRITTLLGRSRNLIQPALYRQTHTPLDAVATTATLADAAIADLQVGYKVHSYLICCGNLDATATAGTRAFTSPLLDTVITRPVVKLDGSVNVRDFISPSTARAWSLRSMRVSGNVPVGWIPIDFCEGEDVNTVFRGDRLTMQNKLQLWGNLTAAAGQGIDLVQCVIEGDPRVLRPGQKK